jgi:hypothetical protein
MFLLHTPKLVSETSIRFDPAVLEAGTCGLFRASLDEAADLMPSMAELIATVPVSDPSRYELDIKVHMLMPGQYPCIPNWHTDMVVRDESGLRFDLIDPAAEPMLLWISDGPETEFLAKQVYMEERPGSHQEIARFMNKLSPRDYHGLFTQSIQPNCWWSMDQRTPHRGTQAAKHGWRVFARVTPKALAPRRPVTSVIRRHAQVYLDASTFGW